MKSLANFIKLTYIINTYRTKRKSGIKKKKIYIQSENNYLSSYIRKSRHQIRRINNLFTTQNNLKATDKFTILIQ